MKWIDHDVTGRNWYARALLPVLLVTVLLLSGCINTNSHQSALDPKGPVAQNQYDAFMLTLYVTGFLWITVGGALLYAVWRFRARKSDDPNAMPKQSHGNVPVELGLVIASAICLVIIAVPTLTGIVYMKTVPVRAGQEPITVEATGFQWWFEFRYPQENVITANEFVVPVDTPIRVNLRSGDVIHSFWLPKLAGKVDFIPGQENFIWFQADEAGEYYGQCAEFCGDSHAYMLFRCREVSDAEYRVWLEHQKKDAALPLDAPAQLVQLPENADEALVAAGQEAFNTHCITCHTLGKSGGKTGPNLTHFASRNTLAAGWLENTPENLYRWIRHPDAVKPGNYMWRGVPLAGAGVMQGLSEKQISDEEIRALVAYLTLLK